MIQFANSKLNDEQFKEFAEFLLANPSNPKNLLNHEAVGDNESLANFLGEQMKITKLGKVDDWEMVKKFAILDNLDLPEYNLCQHKNHSYHVKFGFGLLAYCVSRFAHNRGKTIVDTENRWIDLQLKIKKTLVLPNEDE